MSRRSGFTLVEVMIVVVIMAIIAGVLISSGVDLTGDARKSNARFSLHMLRSQIEMYKAQHDGRVPTATLAELTNRTDVTGTVGNGSTHVYGPYLVDIPANPYTSSSLVRRANADPPPASGASDAGWLYLPTTGKVWIDREELLAE